MFFRTSVFDDFAGMFRDLDRVSRPALAPAGSGETLPATRSSFSRGLYPAVESFTRDGKLVLRAELPGVDKDGLDVTVENGKLTLSGEKKNETESKEADYHVRETRYGRFERSFILPEGVNAEQIEADLTHGVLKVTMPFSEPEKGRKIEIGSGSTDEQKAA